MAAAERQRSAGFLGNIRRGFSRWGRNAKVLVATEPFWGIPMSWVFFYRPIFLKESIGLSEVQIGLLSTVVAFSSVILPLAGGYLADRFGRKKVFMLFDSVAWLSSLTVWIVTQNMWYALAAYMLEGLTYVVFSIWECLLVEDTVPERRASIYGFISVTYSVGSLSTPVAGYLVGLYGVDSSVRMLFAFALGSTALMFAARQAYLRETEIGYQIMKEKRFEGVGGYASSLSMIRKNRVMAALLLTSTVTSLYYSVSVYLPLYLTDRRGLALTEELASLVPAAISISGLILDSMVVPNLTQRRGYVRTLALSHIVGCLGMVLLTSSPIGYLPFALFCGALFGVYRAVAFSVSRTFLTNEIEAVDKKARAKILSVTITLSALLTMPAPAIAGYLFSLEPRLPFIAVSGAIAVSLVVLLLAVRQEERRG